VTVRLLLGAAVLLLLPAMPAPAATDAYDPGLRLRGGRVGDRVVFRIGVRNPSAETSDVSLLLRATDALRWRCRGNGCPAAGRRSTEFTVALVGGGRTLVTGAAGTVRPIVLTAAVLAGSTQLATQHREADGISGPVQRAASKADGGPWGQIALALAAIAAAALALWAMRRQSRRPPPEPRTKRIVATPSAAGGAPDEHVANLWELTAAARAHPPEDPQAAAELDALLFELRPYAGIDGRIPGRLAALVREHQDGTYGGPAADGVSAPDAAASR
jgi:hypothetical protein